MAERLKHHQLGLFGHPVKHSRSPQIHAAFAKQFGIDLDYQLIDASTATLPQQFKDWMQHAHGCNITVPHKNNIMPLLDHYTERAHLSQAVNTVYWQAGELWGDNTDGDGLVLDLQQKNTTLKGARVLIIGAGGATQGIIPSLLNHGVTHISIKNRDLNKADKLAAQFDRCATYDPSDTSGFDLLIHATSMGHKGLCPSLESTWFNANTTAYDLSYGRAAEAFLKAAQAQGASRVFDGLGMLYGQAALAFEIWFGHRPVVSLPPGS